MISEQRKDKIQNLYSLIEERKRNYGVVDFRPQDFQIDLMNAIKQKSYGDDGKIRNKNRFLLFQGGNGSGKTAAAMYIVTLLALGELAPEYGLPYIGKKKDMFVGTESGFTLKSNIQKYLLDDFSITRIPPELIKKIERDNGLVKVIRLTNGCKITFFTYDQGRKRIQGTNGDFYLFDEEPTDSDIFNEGVARVRGPDCQMLLSFTPLSGYTAAYEWFYEQQIESIKNESYLQLVNSLQNKHADNTALLGMNEQERKMRVEGLFVPPSGLVFGSFSRAGNTIKYFDPKELGYNTRFYGAVDFGVNHPTAFAFIAVDEDDQVYVFDLIYESNLLLKDLARMIKQKQKKYGIEFEYIIADSAAKRERTELQEYGIRTTPADKRSKGENGDSNRRAGIMKVNQMLHDGKLYLADHLKDAIKEFESHHYKLNSRDGAVEKTQDDFLDALRYFIFVYQPPKYKSLVESDFERKYNLKYNKRSLAQQGRNVPY